MNELRDWGGLGGVINEAKQIAKDEQRHVDPDCPVCGTPLQVNRRGERSCPMGHYRDQGAPR